jgi:hypothetical protein
MRLVTTPGNVRTRSCSAALTILLARDPDKVAGLRER